MLLPTYIINLEERKDRREYSLSQFSSKPEFQYQIVNAIKHDIGSLGLWKSILNCVKEGVKNNYDFIIICEDDHTFSEGYSSDLLISCIQRATHLKCDILLGGVSWFQDVIFSDDSLCQIQLFSGTQFVILFNHTFETILNTHFKDKDIADGKLCLLFKKIFCIYPFISTQKDFGYSDATKINNTEWRVRELFEKSTYSIDTLKSVYDHYQKPATDISFLKEFDFSKATISTYIINLKDRKERLEHVKEQFANRPEFDLTIIEAIKHETGALGLWLSMRKAIEMAIANDDEVIVICEDDHQFTENYSREIFLKSVIIAQHIGIEYISGGCSYFEHPVPITPNLYWVAFFQATQFIVLYKPAFEKILNEPFDSTIIADIRLSAILPNKMIFYPGLSVQHDFGYSDVTTIHNQQKDLVTNLFRRTSLRLDDINTMTVENNAFVIKF